jgi:hypothetical protein
VEGIGFSPWKEVEGRLFQAEAPTRKRKAKKKSQ